MICKKNLPHHRTNGRRHKVTKTLMYGNFVIYNLWFAKLHILVNFIYQIGILPTTLLPLKT
jgi:hypothetical protein